MYKLYHGTTVNGAKDIIENGYDYFKGQQPWSCSNPKHMYFFNPVKIVECDLGLDLEEATEDDYKDAENRAQQYAKEAADIVNALKENPDSQVCVMELIFDKEIELEMLNWLGEDYSCENMELASTLPVDFINDCIKNHKVKIIVYYYNFFTKLSLFYLLGIFNNSYAIQAMERLPKEEYNTLIMLAGIDCCYIIDTICENSIEPCDRKVFN